MYLIIFLLFSLTLVAAPQSVDSYEKTFPRDNTFCQLAKSRVEFSLRGFSRFTEASERGYGEVLFLEKGKEKKLIDISEGNSGTYRFFRGKSRACSKYQGYDLDDSTFALLLLKSNHPHKDKLVIQLIDRKAEAPLKTIHTQYLTDRSLPAPDGFFFRTHNERLDIDMGTITRDEHKFTYQDRDFQEWYHFGKKGFSISPSRTYLEFSFKDYFTDEADFLKAAGWSETEKKFTHKVLYLAVNHALRKECVLLVSERQKLSGNEEGWRCREK